MDDKQLQSGADAHDYAVGQKSPEEVGYPFLRGQQAVSDGGKAYQDSKISDFEDKNGIPYTAIKLGYGDKFTVDPHVEMKVRAIDEYVRQTMQEKGLRDSPFGYQESLAQMAGKLAESVESAKNHNQMKSILDNLFMQVSFANGMSSKTYLQEYQKRHTATKIGSSLKELGKALKILNKHYES